MTEGKGVALAILGVVAVIAVVGLVLLFSGATAKVVAPGAKLYGGNLDRGPASEGFVRYKTGRFLEGEEYVFPPRIKDSGDQPVPRTYTEGSYKRTGPINPDKCSNPRYPNPTTSLYAWNACIQSSVDPVFYCCPSGSAAYYG